MVPVFIELRSMDTFLRMSMVCDTSGTPKTSNTNSRQLAKVENLPTFAGFVNGELVKQAMGTKIESVKGVLNEVAGD